MQQPAAQTLHQGKPQHSFRIYLRLRAENPALSGKAAFKSFARRSITFAPHPNTA